MLSDNYQFQRVREVSFLPGGGTLEILKVSYIFSDPNAV